MEHMRDKPGDLDAAGLIESMTDGNVVSTMESVSRGRLNVHALSESGLPFSSTGVMMTGPACAVVECCRLPNRLDAGADWHVEFVVVAHASNTSARD